MNCSIRVFHRKVLFVLFGLSLFSLSCEEVIKVDLKSASPIMVAEGAIVKDSAGWVRLSYTRDYFTSGESSYIENATVLLADDKGRREYLKYAGDGTYRGHLLKGIPARNYAITISGTNFSQTASSKLNAPPQLYSVRYTESSFQRPYETVKSFNIRLKFSDDPSEENFYNVEFFRNGKRESDGYNIITDYHLSAGDTVIFSPRWKLFESGEVVVIKLYSIDRKTYLYYSQLNDILTTGMGGSSTPYNPVSNFGSSILGFFKAYSSVSFTSVVR